MYRSIGYYSQKPLTLWVVGNGSTDHLEDIWASVIMGQTRSRVAHKVSSQRYNSTHTAIRECRNMTLQTHDKIDNAPAILTDEQRRRVADTLERAQSVNTRRNYASELRQFRSWCQQENYSPLTAHSEVVAAYAAELS